MYCENVLCGFIVDEGELTDSMLVNLSREFTSKYDARNLAWTGFKIEQSIVESILRDYRSDIHEAMYHILMEWRKSQENDQIAYVNLCRGLRKVEKDHLIRKVMVDVPEDFGQSEMINNAKELTDDLVTDLCQRFVNASEVRYLAVSGLGMAAHLVDRLLESNPDVTEAMRHILMEWKKSQQNAQIAYVNLCRGLKRANMDLLIANVMGGVPKDFKEGKIIKITQFK